MLEFVDALFSALGSQPTPPPTNAVGALWSLPVPGSRQAVDGLFAYAAQDGFEFSIASGLIQGRAKLDGAALEPLPDALGVHICFKENGEISRGYHKRIELPYPSPAIKRLCHGEPADFGRMTLQADPAHLLPEISNSLTSSGPDSWVNLSWLEHPLSAECALSGWKRLFRRLSRFEILGITLRQNHGELIARGANQYLLPQLIWT